MSHHRVLTLSLRVLTLLGACWLTLASASQAQTTLWSAEGQSSAEYLGSLVVSVGDVDGDLVPDVAVGSPGFDGLAGTDAGKVTIFSGLSGALITTLEGDTAVAHFGTSITGLGDLDSDGRDEFVIGAPDFVGSNGTTGRAYLVSGASSLVLSMLDGESGVWLGDGFGTSVANAGDVDGDSFNDLIVGAPRHDSVVGGWTGRVYLVSGASFSVIRYWDGDVPWCLHGLSVNGVGDTDLDGFPDVIAGAPFHPANDPPYSGKAFVYSGATGQTIWTFAGDAPIGNYASFVGGAGDLDLDGTGDLIVSAPELNLASFNSGRVQVYSGATSALLWFAAGSVEDELFGGVLLPTNDYDHDGIGEILSGARGAFGPDGWGQGSVSVLSGATGIPLMSFGGETSYDRFGASIAVMPDLNGDGSLEFAVGAWGFDGMAGFECGKVYLESLDPTLFVGLPPTTRAAMPPSSNRLAGGRTSFFPVFRGRIDLDGDD